MTGRFLQMELPEGGAVTANWTVLTPKEIQGPAGMVFWRLPDDSILAGGEIPATGTYDVRFISDLSGITGVRLEALEHAILPNGTGPGFYQNGNFVLTELQMYAIPHRSKPKDCRP
jgi:hypothetical protein